jgi:hypothetical protein
VAAPIQAQALVLIPDRVVELIQAQAVVHTLVQVAAPTQAQGVEHTLAQVVGLILGQEGPVIPVQVVAVMTNGTALLLTANRI